VTVPTRSKADFDALKRIAFFEAQKVLSVSGFDEAEDVANEAMFEFIRYEESNDVRNPGGLVRIIARRLAFKMRDGWEERKDNQVALADDSDDDVERGVDGGERVRGVRRARPADPKPDPLDALIAQRELELVRCAVAQLNEQDRRIAELTYLDEPRLKAPAVGALLELNEGTVRNHLVRIRKELARMLTDEPDRG